MINLTVNRAACWEPMPRRAYSNGDGPWSSYAREIKEGI